MVRRPAFLRLGCLGAILVLAAVTQSSAGTPPTPQAGDSTGDTLRAARPSPKSRGPIVVPIPPATPDSVPRFQFEYPDTSVRPPRGLYYEEYDAPILLKMVPAKYPPEARAAGIEGKVIVNALIGQDGRVKRTEVVQGVPALDRAAVTAVKQYRFKPFLVNGKTMAVWVAIPVVFRLHSE